jgi:hypothetical protein
MSSGLGRRPGKQGQSNHPTPLKAILRRCSVAKDDSGRDTEQSAEKSGLALRERRYDCVRRDQPLL